VRVAAVGQAVDGDVDEGAAQDRQGVAALEPAPAAVELGVDIVPGLGPDGAVERGVPEARRDGYRAHMAADPETGIITDEKLTGAAGAGNSDAAVAAQFVAAEDPAGTAGDDGDRDEASQLAWYGDSAYGTGELREAIAAAGHRAVIKPWPLLPAVEGGFTVDDFTVDAAARTVTCPAGVTRHLTAKNAAIFGIACRDCPLRASAPPPRPAAPCTCTSTTACCMLPGRTGPPAPGCARTTWCTGPTSSGPSPQAATRRGRRLKLRYRGTARNHAWLKHRTAAINLRVGKGLARRNGAWVLAT